MDWSHWRLAAAAIARNLKTPDFARGWLSAGLAYEAEPKARVTDLHAMYPELSAQTIDMGPVSFHRSNMDPIELFILSALCRLRHTTTVFEIGTYDGATTSVLASSSLDLTIFTLDLPETDHDDATVSHERENIARGGVGARFADSDFGDRITQLRGDSRTFDFSRWYGSVDLVIVDGGHEYDCVSSDTANALKMVRPDGIVVWDDYTRGWPAVVEVVDALPEEIHRHCFRPGGTQLAIYDRFAAI